MRKPDIVANFYLSEVGVQVDVIYDGKTMSICRDIGRNLPVDKSIKWITGSLYRFVVDVREELEEMASTR